MDRVGSKIVHGRLLAESNPEEAWGWTSAAGRVRFERRARMISAAAELGPGRRVLEVGCGTGLFTATFAQTGSNVTALDVSPELLAKARQRNLPVQLVEGRLETLEMEERFDAIIGSSVLHHLDVEAAVARMWRLLRPGGRICFAEPNLLNPQVWAERRFRFFKRWFWYVSPEETAFQRRQLARLLTHSGFEQVKVTPFDWVHPATPSFLVPSVRAAGGLLEWTPIMREFAGSLLIQGRRPQR